MPEEPSCDAQSTMARQILPGAQNGMPEKQISSSLLTAHLSHNPSDVVLDSELPRKVSSAFGVAISKWRAAVLENQEACPQAFPGAPPSSSGRQVSAPRGIEHI